MSLASRKYYQIALQIEKELELEEDPAKKRELRKVAGQNFFYCGVEAIEFILKRSGVDLYSINDHKERLKVIQKYANQFKQPAELVLKYQIMIEYDYRRKVAYKGENGNKFKLIKEFAEVCMRELENE